MESLKCIHRLNYLNLYHTGREVLQSQCWNKNYVKKVRTEQWQVKASCVLISSILVCLDCEYRDSGEKAED